MFGDSILNVLGGPSFLLFVVLEPSLIIAFRCQVCQMKSAHYQGRIIFIGKLNLGLFVMNLSLEFSFHQKVSHRTLFENVLGIFLYFPFCDFVLNSTVNCFIPPSWANFLLYFLTHLFYDILGYFSRYDVSHLFHLVQVSLHRLESMVNLNWQSFTCVFCPLNWLLSQFLALWVSKLFQEDIFNSFLNLIFHQCCRLPHTKRYYVPEGFVYCVYLFRKCDSTKYKGYFQIVDNGFLATWKKSRHKICAHMYLLNVVNEKVYVLQIQSHRWA